MDSYDLALLAVHAGATCFLAGLIWFVQVVHYPLMAQVGRSNFVVYEALHQRRTTLVVGPAMVAEAASAVLIAFRAGELAPGWLAYPGVAMVALLWASTFLVQVPMHAALGQGLNPRALRRLVMTNWIRTALWSARAVLALVMLAGALDGDGSIPA